MKWKIIKENHRKYADETYYLKAEKICPEGLLTLEIDFVERFMYDLTVQLKRNKPKKKLIFFKDKKPDLLYSCLVFYNERIEKYGYQIMRMTEISPIQKLNRINSFQKDAVLNWNLREKFNIDLTSELPEKK
jgi:hypothetical protein